MLDGLIWHFLGPTYTDDKDSLVESNETNVSNLTTSIFNQVTENVTNTVRSV